MPVPGLGLVQLVPEPVGQLRPASADYSVGDREVVGDADVDASATEVAGYAGAQDWENVTRRTRPDQIGAVDAAGGVVHEAKTTP